MNVVVKTNLGEASAALKFNITIEYTKENQKLTRENSKSAGSFRDTKTYINLVVEKIQILKFVKNYLMMLKNTLSVEVDFINASYKNLH